jgi:hypothetical protein
MNKPDSLTIEVCSLCGEMAGQSAHGHSGQKWHWQQVEYIPKPKVERLSEAQAILISVRVWAEIVEYRHSDERVRRFARMLLALLNGKAPSEDP